MKVEPGLGSDVAGYRLVSLLGRGGMSSVYLAEDSRLGRKVAFKILSAELAQDRAFRDRFVRESRLAASLDHPNIVPIFQAGEADGVLYIAMRYVEGTDLKTLIKEQGPLEIDFTEQILVQVGAALDVAHAQGLVHRDVKPGNILVDSGAEGAHDAPRAYLADFGLTKRMSSKSALTASGQFVGTIDYASPEQILAEVLDGRADQYSLACVAYQCLTGVVPFPREHEMAIMWAHVQDRPPRVSDRRPDLPPAVDGVIARAMAKAAEDRYPSCSAFASAVADRALAVATHPGEPRGARPARGPKVIFAHHPVDSPAVARVAEKLEQAGLTPVKIHEYLYRDPEIAVSSSLPFLVFVGGEGLGEWEREEISVVREAARSRKGFRLIPVLLPGLPEPFDPRSLPPFLAAQPWVDLRQGLEDPSAFRGLVDAITTGSTPGRPREGVRYDVSPYRGLQPFEEEDAVFFFGREGDTQRLVEELKATRFLAVLGPSGSGKSSLVRAGLIPAVRAGEVSGSEDWPIGVFRPGPHPLLALARALAEVTEAEASDELLVRLRRDPTTVHLAAALCTSGQGEQARVALVVDQFEEAFTLCADEGERKAFIEALLHASTIPGGRTVVVLTMRADFYPHCAAYPDLAAAVSGRQFLVSPISWDGLRRAIGGPAGLVGLSFEEGLIETILDNVGIEPGALPLLEHALFELWAARRGGWLTLEAYLESGGVRGAIATRAEAIYEGLEPYQREICRRIMLRLTQPGEGTEDTRRRARASELLTRPEDESELDQVLEEMVAARLLTLTSEPETGERWVDVSHEALIRAWPKLKAWIDEDRAGLLLHRRLTNAAAEWDRLGRDESVLHRGARLTEAVEWEGRHPEALNPLERDFVVASVELQERERQETEGRRQKELADARRVARAQRRAARLLRLVAAVLVLGLTASSIAAFLAVAQRKTADRQRETALSRELAASAISQLQAEPGLSLLLAIQAAEIAPTEEAHEALLEALTASYEHLVVKGGPAVFSPNGKLVAAAVQGGIVRIWDVRTRNEVGSLRQPSQRVSGVAFSPDGKSIATGGDAGTVWVWDLDAGEVRLELPGGHQSVSTLQFSADGARLVTAGDDTGVRVWDANSGRMLAETPTDTPFGVALSPDGRLLLTGDTGSFAGFRLWEASTGRYIGPVRTGREGTAAFSADGSSIAIGDDRGDIALFDAPTGDVAPFNPGDADADPIRPRRLIHKAHSGYISSVRFSSDGRFLVSAGADKSARIWDVATGKHDPLVVLNGHSGAVTDAGFAPDGTLAVTASDDGTARVWDVSTGESLFVLRGHVTTVLRARFSSDGRFVLTEADDGTARIWKIAGEPPVFLQGHRGTVLSVAFSPDGRFLATGGEDRTARVWDLETRKARELAHPRGVLAATFDPEGKLLATAGEDGDARIWRVATGENMGVLEHTLQVYSVSFSPDGKLLATGSGLGGIGLWERRPSEVRRIQFRRIPGARSLQAIVAVRFSRDGRFIVAAGDGYGVFIYRVVQRRTFESVGYDVPMGAHEADFSPNGRSLVAGGQDGTVRLVDTASRGRILATFEHPASVNSVHFSPDGRFVVTACADGLVRVWDVKRGRIAASWGEPGRALRSVSFSPDGKLVASVGDDGLVRLDRCDVCGPLDYLLAVARSRASRSLTPAERGKYLHEK